MKTDVDAGVQVIDPATNQPVSNVPVYFISCNPNNKDIRDLHYSNVTGSDGWALFSVTYYMNEGDTLYLGASTDKSLVESDFADRNFGGSGKIGAWKSFSYSLVKPDDIKEGALISVALTIDKETGKLID